MGSGVVSKSTSFYEMSAITFGDHARRRSTPSCSCARRTRSRPFADFSLSPRPAGSHRGHQRTFLCFLRRPAAEVPVLTPGAAADASDGPLRARLALQSARVAASGSTFCSDSGGGACVGSRTRRRAEGETCHFERSESGTHLKDFRHI